MLLMMGYENTKIQEVNEIDIVYSALAEKMSEAVDANWRLSIEQGILLRDACLVNALNKIYNHYKQSGLF